MEGNCADVFRVDGAAVHFNSRRVMVLHLEGIELLNDVFILFRHHLSLIIQSFHWDLFARFPPNQWSPLSLLFHPSIPPPPPPVSRLPVYTSFNWLLLVRLYPYKSISLIGSKCLSKASAFSLSCSQITSNAHQAGRCVGGIKSCKRRRWTHKAAGSTRFKATVVCSWVHYLRIAKWFSQHESIIYIHQ